MSEKITFSFGKNWQDYLNTVDEKIIGTAAKDITEWFGSGLLTGKRVIDVGSGSGLSSLSFHRMQPEFLHSFDYDPNSVAATQSIAAKFAPQAENWKIEHGSVLDRDYIDSLGNFDIVYSWGVLHHTGDMWTAIDHASRLVRDGGTFLLSIYQAGPTYEADLALKRRYNEDDEAVKKELIDEQIALQKKWAAERGEDPEDWNKVDERGMNVYNDIIDWLGGLPYEVAYLSQIIIFLHARGFIVKRVLERSEGGCSVYLFEKKTIDIMPPFSYSHYTTPNELNQIDLLKLLAMQSVDGVKRGARHQKQADLIFYGKLLSDNDKTIANNNQTMQTLRDEIEELQTQAQNWKHELAIQTASSAKWKEKAGQEKERAEKWKKKAEDLKSR